MTSQQLEQLSKIPTTKAKGCILQNLNKGPNDKGEGLYPPYMKQ